uniref:Methane monooxygenase protein C1 n=1 Tax=Methylococcaceae bacterium ET-HIRO TaxID=557143 RepID=B9X093_9GAMM|nr:methane monooxygenase protein C1 [Methylococcaceae bacterium ET-HIRO]
MNTVVQNTAPGVKPEGRYWFLDLKVMAMGVIFLIIMFSTFRWYQGWAAWEYGLDSTSPEFDQYWMTLLWAEIAAELIIFTLLVGSIWITRDRNLEQLAPRVEFKRTVFFISLIVIYGVSFYFAGSFFAEQDASWHQTVVRDTAFTPSHIGVFYLGMPTFIIIGTSIFTYAMTRLPYFSKQISIPLTLVVVGPFLLLPTVGYNEWGHAFWIMEEYFTVPLHWGFVLFGWSILALGGLLVQLLTQEVPRMLAAIYDEEGELIED